MCPVLFCTWGFFSIQWKLYSEKENDKETVGTETVPQLCTKLLNTLQLQDIGILIYSPFLNWASNLNQNRVIVYVNVKKRKNMQECGRLKLMYQKEHVTAFFPSSEMEDTLSSMHYLFHRRWPIQCLREQTWMDTKQQRLKRWEMQTCDPAHSLGWCYYIIPFNYRLEYFLLNTGWNCLISFCFMLHKITLSYTISKNRPTQQWMLSSNNNALSWSFSMLTGMLIWKASYKLSYKCVNNTKFLDPHQHWEVHLKVRVDIFQSPRPVTHRLWIQPWRQPRPSGQCVRRPCSPMGSF